MFTFFKIFGSITKIFSSIMGIISIISSFVFMIVIPKLLKLIGKIFKRRKPRNDYYEGTQTKPNIKREDIDRCNW